MVESFKAYKIICEELAYNGFGFRVEIREERICIFFKIHTLDDCDYLDDMLNALYIEDKIISYDFDGEEYYVSLNRF